MVGQLFSSRQIKKLRRGTGFVHSFGTSITIKRIDNGSFKIPPYLNFLKFNFDLDHAVTHDVSIMLTFSVYLNDDRSCPVIDIISLSDCKCCSRDV